MNNHNVDIMSWNVRGLNSGARCLAVHEMRADNICHIACLQETKLQSIDSALASFLGAYRLNNFAYKPAVGTKGGILLLWNNTSIDLTKASIGRFSISVDDTLRHNMTTFRITAVYGPARHPEKEAFLQHLRNIKPTTGSRWLLLGDFNLIYKASNKNNRSLNLHLMSRFRRALDFCELKEMALQNRKFTWSNEHCHPTLVCLDCIFCNQPWELTFKNCALNALSSSHSDHCPLLLTNQDAPRQPTPFRFENFWSRLSGFQEGVASAWNASTTHTEPFHRLGHKLHTTACVLKRWSGSLLSDAC
jgi:exonuclease III